MGKATDIHYGKILKNVVVRPEAKNERQEICDYVRVVCQKEDTLNAQIGWSGKNRFSLESAADGATTWVHIDVRMFDETYLLDKFFCVNVSSFFGKPLTNF